MKNLFILFILAGSLLASCKKDDTAHKEPTVAELLTSGKWYMKEVGGETVVRDCFKKSYYLFAPNGTAVFMNYIENQDGDCIPQGVNGTYVLIDDDTILVGSSEAAIEEISENKLVLLDENGVKWVFGKTEG